MKMTRDQLLAGLSDEADSNRSESCDTGMKITCHCHESQVTINKTAYVLIFVDTATVGLYSTLMYCS